MTPGLGSAAGSGAPSLHHVALGARDVAGLSDFYCCLLETPPLQQHLDSGGALRSVWLDLSGVLLMIERVEALSATPPVTGVAPGAFLLAFRADAAGRRRFEERAAQLGAEVESRSAFTSYLRDPDGNRIAVSEYEVVP